ncbi:nitrate reductase molybdenum cofactor assembly chaperone [Kordiimonas sediminis]|uniref:Nitrate reductase molybdenum cofactor assembly chaperone n=1 Tax=Kordiimonas sediminis TaxID=1735581 RepID=A0A919AS12_9PROT|nr:nitrate reductase molybdenum cofactor assembly chaperone [Kordiimonas sediminis]GHF22256.1 nitrate reductase molybdenum cofactor assembly chaperone [Kordiimonas sediminis]
MKTFKIIGLLLSYPKEDMQIHVDELIETVSEEKLVPRAVERNLLEFMDKLANRNLLEIQEEYVATFDRSRGHSLYLFEHIHGESRDRGQAMVDLIGHYKSRGLELNVRELPDYLPMFLEFLSLCNPKEAQELLGEVVHIIAAVGAKLKAKGNDYHIVFKALASLTKAEINKDFVKQALAEDAARDDSFEALDKEWEDTPAFDGTGAVDCGTCPSAMPRPGVSPEISNVKH